LESFWVLFRGKYWYLLIYEDLLTDCYRLGLSDFLRGKLIERLKAEEAKEKAS
jgi:hypothetical protein